jgi:hypothetical protein
MSPMFLVAQPHWRRDGLLTRWCLCVCGQCGGGEREAGGFEEVRREIMS